MTAPVVLPARQLRVGEVAVDPHTGAAGQVTSVGAISDPRGWLLVEWSDGAVSALESSQPVTRLYSPYPDASQPVRPVKPVSPVPVNPTEGGTQ